jgi:hypothetical protein
MRAYAGRLAENHRAGTLHYYAQNVVIASRDERVNGRLDRRPSYDDEYFVRVYSMTG